MRALIQRVQHSRVVVAGKEVGAIGPGLLILLGITHDDTQSDMDWLLKKIPKLRIFDDPEGKMNLSVTDIGGEILVVSQFTLFANCQKGNRPSYIRSAPPDISLPMYEQFVAQLRATFSGKVATGEFGAMMEVSLLNDGPVTIMLDSRQPEG